MLRISYIVLSFERSHHLRLCLKALANAAKQYYNVEVIVADAGSTENNTEVALAQDGLAVKVVQHPHKYTGNKADAAYGVHQCATTANLGLAHATGDVVQFLQHDHIVAADHAWHLAQIMEHMPPPLHNAIITGYCHFLREDVTDAHVDMLEEMSVFGMPPLEGKENSQWELWPRYERFMGNGTQTLFRTPDWRGIDGFDCAIRRDYCLPLDEEFEGQGFEHMDWVWRQVKERRSTFWCSALLRLYHQPHREVRKEEQWRKELEVAEALFNKKHGEEAWRMQVG